MRQIVFPELHKVEIIDVPKPEIGRDGVLVRTRFSSIVASQDLVVYKGQDPRTSDISSPFYGGFPYQMSGECAGEVVAVGDNVSDFTIGERVVFLGPYAEFVSPQSNMVVKIPENIPYDEAISCAYSATSLQCVRRAALEIGDNVVILGQGVVGLMVTQWCRIAGAGKIIVSDKYPMRLKLAREFGATHTLIVGKDDIAKEVLNLTNAQGADIVIIAATVPELLDFGMSITCQKGRVVVLAFFNMPVTIQDMTKNFFFKEIDIISTMGEGPSTEFTSPYCRWDWIKNIRTGIEFLEAKRIMTKQLITHRLSVKEVAKGLKLLDEEPKQCLKILLNW